MEIEQKAAHAIVREDSTSNQHWLDVENTIRTATSREVPIALLKFLTLYLEDGRNSPYLKIRALRLHHAWMMTANGYYIEPSIDIIYPVLLRFALHRKHEQFAIRGREIFGMLNETQSHHSFQFLSELFDYIAIWRNSFGRTAEGTNSAYFNMYQRLINERATFPPSHGQAPPPVPVRQVVYEERSFLDDLFSWPFENDQYYRRRPIIYTVQQQVPSQSPQPAAQSPPPDKVISDWQYAAQYVARIVQEDFENQRSHLDQQVGNLNNILSHVNRILNEQGATLDAQLVSQLIAAHEAGQQAISQYQIKVNQAPLSHQVNHMPDSEDSELQRALALSQQQYNEEQKQTRGPGGHMEQSTIALAMNESKRQHDFERDRSLAGVQPYIVNRPQIQAPQAPQGDFDTSKSVDLLGIDNDSSTNK